MENLGSIAPGAITFTAMPRAPNSFASHFGSKPVGFEYVQDGQTKTIAMNGSHYRE